MEVTCTSDTLGRTCTCPPGFSLVGRKDSSMFFASGALFAGCQDINECQEYGWPEHSTCVNSGVNERTITCDPGFFLTPPNDNVKVYIGSQAYQECMDFNECVFGCEDTHVVVACTDSTSDPAIPANTRVCTCPNGYIPSGGLSNSSITLLGSDVFEGCIDCSPCPFNSYLVAECNVTHDRQCAQCGEQCATGFWLSQHCNSTVGNNCSRCSECPEGYYIASPCTSRSDVVCLPCDPPCQSPLYEARSCANGLNRACNLARTPQCIGGCGMGVCVDTNVCECPLSDGSYGPKCEFNCHTTCMKYSATCEISIPGRTWWCECPPGSFNSRDNQKCIPDDSDHNCLWSEWGEWNACSSCGSTRSREAPLVLDKSDASCGKVYLERQVCDTNCFNEDQLYIAQRTKPESGAYHALSLSLFWKKNVAKYISAKQNISLVLSDDPQADAHNERFIIFFYGPVNYLETRKRSESELCAEKNIDDAVNDVIEITYKYMEEVLLTPQDAVSYKLQECELVYNIKSPGELVVWPIFGGVVGGMALIVVLLCIAFIWYKNRPLDFSILPPPVRWQYEQYQSNPSSWVKDSSGKFFKKELSTSSEDFQKLAELFYGHLKASARVEIKEAYAIYNPLLVTSFMNYRSIITTRMVEQSNIFAKQDWQQSKAVAKKQLVFDKYLKRCIDMGWNNALDVPILVTCHGTTWNLAVAIASTGFSSLSSVEGGWHGVGVYFTTMQCTVALSLHNVMIRLS
eukprot:TRINITY_DN6057_c0_g1_i3.p1 TRINITY_DN6057_c0_g1~~TRINITY_DN6057_c0_g1_i3.p1  ORF type:complete len:742 (+),score=89.65 TRINITY_DN6057_c0_g1_i3:1693-3918(+)